MPSAAASARNILALISLCLLAQTGLGQANTSKVTVPDDLVVRQTMSRAEESLAAGDLERTIKIWQDVLDRMGAKVVDHVKGRRLGSTTDTVVNGDIYLGVRLEVMKKIRALGDEGLKIYERLMEPKAKRMLESASQRMDENLLRTAASRYFLAPSGKAAWIALTDLLLEQGRFDEARIHAQSLRSALSASAGPESKGLSIQAMAREAIGLWGAGDHESLQKLDAIVKAQWPSATIKAAGDDVPLRTFVSGLMERSLADLTKAGSSTTPPLSAMKQRVWAKGFGRNLNRGHSETLVFASTTRQPMMVHCPVIPVVRDGAVYYSDGRAIRSRSLFTGEEVWRPISSPIREFQGRRNRNLYYHVVLDGDALFAYLEGEPTMVGQSAWQGFDPIETIPCHKLTSVDIATGEVRWSHSNFSTEDSVEADFIKRLNVNQPPVIVGDTVFVAGTVLLGVFHQWVCAFDRDTGHLRWRTYTGAGQMELNMFGNPIKEGVPGHVVEHEGVIYYCSNIGVLSALDAVTGTPLWESAYEQEPIPTTDSPVTRERHPGWMPSRPAIWKNKLFFAPTDSYGLYAADLKTGKLTSISAATRNIRTRNAYFLGIHQGQALVAGSCITSINPDTLGVNWRTTSTASRTRSRSNTAIQGRPAVVGNKLFFTSEGSSQRTEVYQVDLKTGRFKERFALKRMSQEGNLVITPDAILVATTESINAYFDMEDVESRLERAASSGKPNPELLMRLGDVRQRRMQWARALSAFERALEIASSQGPRGRQVAHRAKLALYNGWMAIADQPSQVRDSGPQGHEKRYRKAMSYARTDAQKTRSLMELLNWSVEASEWGAFQRAREDLERNHASQWVDLKGSLHGLFPDLPNNTRLPAGLLATLSAGMVAMKQDKPTEAVGFLHSAQSEWPQIPVGPETTWQYAGRRIEQLIADKGRKVYRVQEAQAKKLLTQARSSKDLQGIRTVLKRYPQSSIVEEAYLILSRELLAAKEYQGALSEMLRYFARFQRTSAASLMEYARCLDELKAYDSAFQIAQVLVRVYPNDRGMVDKRSVTVGGWAKKFLSRDVYAARSLKAKGKAKKLPAAMVETWTFGDPKANTEARVLTPKGRAPANAANLVIAHVARELVALDATTGELKWRKAAVSVPHHILWHDQHLLTKLGNDVVALDAVSGNEKWRLRPEDGKLVALDAGHGKAYLLLQSIVRGGMTLKGIDMFSGVEVQSTSLQGYYTGSLSISPAYVLVTAPRDRRAICLDALTGKRVGRAIAFSSQETPPFLNDEDQIILVTGSSQRRMQPVQVRARNPMTGDDAWVFEAGKGSFTPFDIKNNQFVFELQTAAQRGRRGSLPHRLFVLDLSTGKSLLKTDLPPNEFVTSASVHGDRAYLRVMAGGKSASGISQKVRAFNMGGGGSAWSTVEFSGSNVKLETYDTEKYLLVRKTLSYRRSLRQLKKEAELLLVDKKNGKAVDLLTLGPAELVSHDAGLGVFEGGLVITTGPILKGMAAQ